MSQVVALITAHKIQSLALLLILPLVGIGVYLAVNQTALRSRASSGTEPEFLFSPATQNVTAGGAPITIDVQLDFKRKPVIFFQNEIQYDVNVFDVTNSDIKPGPLFARSDGSSSYGVFPPNSIKVENGNIKFSWLGLDPATKARLRGLLDRFQSICVSTGTGDDCRITLAQITLKAKASAVSGNSRLIFGPPDKNFVLLADDLGTTGSPPKHGIITAANSKEINITVSGGTTGATCSLGVNRETIGLSDSATFSLTTTGLPAGATAVFKGKNNGTAIAEAAVPNFVINGSTQNLSFTGTQFGGAGTYERSVVVRSGSTDVCTTEVKTVTVSSGVVPPVVACNLTVNRTSGGLNDDFVFTLNSPALAGAGIPSGSDLFMEGTNPSGVIPSATLDKSTSSPQNLGSFKGSAFGGAGNYTRYVTVKRNGVEICKTVPLNITVAHSGQSGALSCVLTATPASFRTDQSTTLAITASGGTIPAGAQAYFAGENGSTEINEALAGAMTGQTFSASYTGTQFGGVGNYTRLGIVKSGNTILCATPRVNITVAPAGGVAVPACSLALNKETIGLNDSTTLSLTTSNLPAGATAVFKGKNNGTAIAEAAVAGFVANGSTPNLSFTGSQFGGAGTYERSVVIRNGGTDICQTSPQTVTVSAATVPPAVACSLSVDKTSGSLNDTFTFTLNSPALSGVGIPSGSELIWQGTNNSQAIPAASAGASTSSPQEVGSFTGTQLGGAGTYTRYIQVKRNGVEICQTIPVTVTVQIATAKYSVQDAVAMIAAWGPITAGNRANNSKWDLNQDNVINIKDWAILYANKL